MGDLSWTVISTWYLLTHVVLWGRCREGNWGPESCNLVHGHTLGQNLTQLVWASLGTWWGAGQDCPQGPGSVWVSGKDSWAWGPFSPVGESSSCGMGSTETSAAQRQDVAGLNAPQSQRRWVILAMNFRIWSHYGKGCLKLWGVGPDQRNDIMASSRGPGLPVVNEFGFHRVWNWARMTWVQSVL